MADTHKETNIHMNYTKGAGKQLGQSQALWSGIRPEIRDYFRQIKSQKEEHEHKIQTGMLCLYVINHYMNVTP